MDESEAGILKILLDKRKGLFNIKITQIISFTDELAPEKLSEEEKEEVKEQVEQYKKYAALIQQGDYYRLLNPFQDDYPAYQIELNS